MAVAGEYNSDATVVGSDGAALPTLPNNPSTGNSQVLPAGNEDALLTRLDRQLRAVWSTRISGPNDDTSGGIAGVSSAASSGKGTGAASVRSAVVDDSTAQDKY